MRAAEKFKTTRRAGKLLAQSLAARERAFRKALKRARRACSEPHVHQLRVSLRRLIATLEMLASILRLGELRATRSALKKLLRGFGPLRDAHIRLLYFKELLPQFPALEKPFRAAARRERELIKEAGRVLRRTKPRALARQLTCVRAVLSKKFSNTTVSEDRLKRLRTAVDEAFNRVQHRRARVDATDVATIHRVRVAFKKFRYMAEALRPLLPGLSDRKMERMSDFQTRLGDIQDLEVVASYLTDYARKRRPRVERALTPALRELQKKHTELIRAYIRNQNQIDRFWSLPKLSSRARQTTPTLFKIVP